MAIRVHRRREPHRLTEGTEEGEIASRVLLDSKAGREDGSRGVINGPKEGTGRLGGPEPREGAPIELAQEPGLGPAGAATSVQRGAAAARRRHPGGPQEPAHGRAADRQPLDGGELLREVHVVKPRIPTPGEREHLGAERCGEAIVRRSLPPPVGEPSGSGLQQCRPEPPDLARGELQRFGRLGCCDLLPFKQIEYVQAPSFLWGQGHLSSSSWVRERTEWLNS
jgi:hypothetical protein